MNTFVGNYKRRSPTMFDVTQIDAGPRVKINLERDANLTEFGQATLIDRYLMPGEMDLI